MPDIGCRDVARCREYLGHGQAAHASLTRSHPAPHEEFQLVGAKGLGRYDPLDLQRWDLLATANDDVSGRHAELLGRLIQDVEEAPRLHVTRQRLHVALRHRIPAIAVDPTQPESRIERSQAAAARGRHCTDDPSAITGDGDPVERTPTPRIQLRLKGVLLFVPQDPATERVGHVQARHHTLMKQQRRQHRREFPRTRRS